MTRHIRVISRAPECAQTSNLQIKLETTTSMIDRALLVYRQQPWKATGSSGTSTSTSTTTTTTGTTTEL